MIKHRYYIFLAVVAMMIPLFIARATDPLSGGVDRGTYKPKDICAHVRIKLDSVPAGWTDDDTDLTATTGVSVLGYHFVADKYIIPRSTYEALPREDKILLTGTSTLDEEGAKEIFESLDLTSVLTIRPLIAGSWYIVNGNLPRKVTFEDEGNYSCDADGCDDTFAETSGTLSGIPRVGGDFPFIVRVDGRDNDCLGGFGAKAYVLNVGAPDYDTDEQGRQLISDLTKGKETNVFLYEANYREAMDVRWRPEISSGRLPAGLSLGRKTPSCTKARYESNPVNCTLGGIRLMGKPAELGTRYFNIEYTHANGTVEERTYHTIVSAPSAD